MLPGPMASARFSVTTWRAPSPAWPPDVTTELLYLRDAYLREVRALVTGADGSRVTLDRTVFYPTGGGQPHDTGSLGAARAARPIEVRFVDRGTALADEDLIRTKVNLVPESVTELRVVDIVGLDKQADGGTHVRRTDEVGRVRVVKTESKGKANKRIRIEVLD